MSKYKALLWDIDNTLLDFEAVEKSALQACFDKCGFGEITEEMVVRYKPINHKYWQALEQGRMTKADILVARFREFLELEGLDSSVAEEFDKEYQKQLGSRFVFMEGAEELINSLVEQGYNMYAATNGTKVAQTGKLSRSGLDKIFIKAYISEEIGSEKPTAGFFDFVLGDLEEFSKDEILMIGDSLTSDIKGGIDAGIDTCWFNPKEIENVHGVQPTYEITRLEKLKEILL